MDRRRFVAAIGSVLAAPPARAQQPARVFRIGVLAQVFTLRSEYWKPFFAALGQRGWREGGNYVLEAKETRGDPVRALQLARDLVEQQVDLIFAISTSPAVAAMQASNRIPVVTWCGYPVEAGLATSLARPGGNVTGVANYAGVEVWGKFVELLRELKPAMRELGVLWDYAPPAFPDGQVPLPEIERAAKQLGIRTRVWMVRKEQDLNDALSEIDRGPAEALIMSNGGGIHMQPPLTARISELIARRRLPVIIDVAAPNFLAAGCVLAYSPNGPEILSRLAHFVDRLLRGAKPGELPFEQPSRFDLVFNAKSAKAIGITIPQSLLLRADRVIE